MSTVFTKIIEGEIPSYKIVENDKFFAFLDIAPLTKGHTLVVPKQETNYIFDLNDELLSDMIIFAKRVAEAIKVVVPCSRVGVMVLGLEVPHAHIHLVPINSEKDINLAKERIKLSQEEFQEIAKNISEEFIR